MCFKNRSHTRGTAGPGRRVPDRLGTGIEKSYVLHRSLPGIDANAFRCEIARVAVRNKL